MTYYMPAGTKGMWYPTEADLSNVTSGAYIG